MTDIEVDKQLIAGLRENLADLRKQESVLYKAKGLREHIATIDVDLAEKKKDEADIKAEVGKLVEKKNGAVEKLAGQMTGAMADIVAQVGKPVIEMPDHGGLFLGVEKPDGKRVHGQALSGGERVLFDAALAYAMTRCWEGDAVIVVEAAEADTDRLTAFVKALMKADPDAQIIINSWAFDYKLVLDAINDAENVEFVNFYDSTKPEDDFMVKPIEETEAAK